MKTKTHRQQTKATRITVEIPPTTERQFRTLGAIMGREWRSLLAEQIRDMEYMQDTYLAIAQDAVERANTAEEARTYAHRAASLQPGSVSEERLFLMWQEYNGEIDADEYLTLREAVKILESTPPGS